MDSALQEKQSARNRRIRQLERQHKYERLSCTLQKKHSARNRRIRHLERRHKYERLSSGSWLEACEDWQIQELEDYFGALERGGLEDYFDASVCSSPRSVPSGASLHQLTEMELSWLEACEEEVRQIQELEDYFDASELGGLEDWNEDAHDRLVVRLIKRKGKRAQVPLDLSWRHQLYTSQKQTSVDSALQKKNSARNTRIRQLERQHKNELLSQN